MDANFFSPLELRGDHLCDVHIDAEAGGPGKIPSPWGDMLVNYISGGEFEGPRLRGRVLPGGGDWPSVSTDGTHSMQINARAVWETEDGARLYVRYEGFIVLPVAPTSSALGLAAADPADYYFRTSPIIRTGDERYEWLNKIVCIGIGRFAPGGLGYRIFQIR